MATALQMTRQPDGIAASIVNREKSDERDAAQTHAALEVD
jgi:hypothetical protein